jgi:multidrug efflux system outer membrane protein
MKNKVSAFLVAGSVLLLASCTSPVDKQDSGIPTPSFWNRLTGDKPGVDPNAPLASTAEAQVEQNWWKHFEDPTLDALIAEALKNNKTLQIAKARVEEARASRGLAKSALFPQINGTGSAQRGNQGMASNNQRIDVVEADVQASWEIDFFGANQARTAATAALLESQEASQQAARVALLAEVARTYFDMRNSERQIELTKKNLETENKTLELIKAQLKGALASDFDVQRAAAEVSTTAAMIPALQKDYDAARNRLNVLLGYAPGTKDTYFKATQPMKALHKRIVVAAPATVLAARPDVKVAERNFAASISASQAATLDLFPKISLTALFGLQDSSILPAAAPWSFGGNLLQPILNFGKLESQIDAADARQKQAFLNYQQTVLEALENMENVLSSYLNETRRNASLTDAVAQNRKAAELARLQYKDGFTDLLDVLVAQRNLLDAESNQAASDASLRKDLANIYTAAGGGWAD